MKTLRYILVLSLVFLSSTVAIMQIPSAVVDMLPSSS
jgi:hypothetical protein